MLTCTIGTQVTTTPAWADEGVVRVECADTNTDDETIQAAINGSSPGDEIVIEGRCLINATVELPGERSYRGTGRTVIKQADGANLDAMLASASWTQNTPWTGTPTKIRDLVLDGNKAANPSGGDALVIRSWHTLVENLDVTRANGNGIKVTNLSRNGTALTNTQVNGTIRNVFVEHSGAHGIYIQDTGNAVTDWNLLDSWISGSGQNGIRMENAAGWTIERNHLYGNGRAAISAHRLYATCVCDNYIEDFATNGIEVTVQGGAASTIALNRVFQFRDRQGGTFIAITQVNYGTGQVVVSANTVRGRGSGTGLSYERGANQLTVTSAANSVTSVGTPRTVGAGVTVDEGI